MKGLVLGFVLASAGFAAVSQAHGVSSLLAGPAAKGHGGGTAGHGPLGGCDFRHPALNEPLVCRINFGSGCCR